MKNFVKKGIALGFTNSTGDTIYSGDPVIQVGLVGVSTTTVLDGEEGEMQMEGVYEFPMNGAIPAIGTPLYWNATTKECDTDHTVGAFIGNCAASVCDMDNGVRVLLPGEGHPAGDALTAQPAIADIAVANATDLATAEALANANKAKINAILAALRLAGVIAP